MLKKLKIIFHTKIITTCNYCKQLCFFNHNIAPLQVHVTYIAATVNTAKCHYIIFSVIPSIVKSFNNQSRFCPQITPKTILIFLTGPGLSHSPQGDNS